MAKKIILSVVIVACVSAMLALSCWEREPAPPALPMGGSGNGGNSSGPSPDGGTKESMIAPDFTLEDLNGAKVTLSDLRGQVVLINFWSSHCPPCLMEMPSFQKLDRAMAGKPFKLLTISADQPRVAEETLAKLGVELTVLPDPTGAVTMKYGVYFSPETFIIAPDGTIDNRIMGAANWGDVSVVEYLDALIKTFAEKEKSG